MQFQISSLNEWHKTVIFDTPCTHKDHICQVIGTWQKLLPLHKHILFLLQVAFELSFVLNQMEEPLSPNVAEVAEFRT